MSSSTATAAAAAEPSFNEPTSFTRLRAYLTKPPEVNNNELLGSITLKDKVAVNVDVDATTAATVDVESDVDTTRLRKRKRHLDNVSKGHPVINAPN